MRDSWNFNSSISVLTRGDFRILRKLSLKFLHKYTKYQQPAYQFQQETLRKFAVCNSLFQINRVPEIMSVTSFESSFLTNPLTSTFKPKRTVLVPVNSVSFYCRQSPDDHKDPSRFVNILLVLIHYFWCIINPFLDFNFQFLWSCSGQKVENQLAKLAIVTMAAGVLTLGSVDPASAAKTGGRVGGQAFRSSAPRSSGPRINNSR